MLLNDQLIWLDQPTDIEWPNGSLSATALRQLAERATAPIAIRTQPNSQAHWELIQIVGEFLHPTPHNTPGHYEIRGPNAATANASANANDPYNLKNLYEQEQEQELEDAEVLEPSEYYDVV